LALSLLLTLATARAGTPKEAIGFFGTVTGAVTAVPADDLSFSLTVSKADADPRSAVKDTDALVGKVLELGTRMPRKDGVPANSEEDIAYIKSLKVGDVITIKVFAVRGNPSVLRMQGPGKPATTEPS
jgi:hypothetical protein